MTGCRGTSECYRLEGIEINCFDGKGGWGGGGVGRGAGSGG